jgi:hypothetical protein
VSSSSGDSAEKGGDNAARSSAKPYPPELMDAHDVSTNRQLSEVRRAGLHPTDFDDEIPPAAGQLSLL